MDRAEKILAIATYAIAAVAVVLTSLQPGLGTARLGALEIAVIVCAALPAGFLLTFSLFGLVSYFVFIPSLSHDGHLFARVHGPHLLHPLTTSVVLGVLALSVVSRSPLVWGLWILLMLVFAVHTALIVRRVRAEHLMDGTNGDETGLPLLLLNLILGGELMTIAAGARPLAPWKLHTLPEHTWIVDVRTGPEFHWNRLRSAENYPFGAGVIDAAKNRPKDAPVLVVCFSGHRSPPVAVMLRKLGFTNVYNLNWGLLYLLLLERGRKTPGPLGLIRSFGASQPLKGDIKAFTLGYSILGALTAVGAPVECFVLKKQIAIAQSVLGGAIGITGLTLGILSFLALGKNFRPFMAPKVNSTLVTTGIYKYIRHPMYIGTILALLGLVVAFGSLLVIPAWLGVAILYLIKIEKEEPLLLEKFPDYAEYRRRTWHMIPYIY